jgi:3-keto-5-aminohexanoate cleavage enzyme
MRKLILTVAPVSAVSLKTDPLATARDVIASIGQGASIVHLHVRDENTRLTDDLTALKKTVEAITAESDAIIQVSTGGVSQMTIEQRCAPLYYEKVEMASLNVGSVNLGEAVYQNPMRDVRYCAEQLVKQGILPETEIFEIGMIHTLIELSQEYSLRKPMLLNMILGVKGAAPATIETLVAMRSFVPKDAMWGYDDCCGVSGGILCAAGVRRQRQAGRHLRCGQQRGDGGKAGQHDPDMRNPDRHTHGSACNPGA